MLVRHTEYLKDAAKFKPMRAPVETEIDKETFLRFVEIMGFKETNKPGHYWKRTAYDRGETLDIICEN